MAASRTFPVKRHIHSSNTRLPGPRPHRLILGYLGTAPSEPARTLWPSESVNALAAAKGFPFRAGKASTVIVSPGFNEVRSRPRETRAAGAAASTPHLVTVPDWSLTSR